MSDFLLYFKLGFWHVLDFYGFDHILFLMALTVPFSIKNWRPLLAMVSFFTIGHTLSLSCSLYGVFNFDEKWIEFLIALSIFFTSFSNILNYKKTKSYRINYVFSGFFGIIHGMGFSIYLRMLLENSEQKLLPLLEFALGIEVVQAIVVLFILGVFIFSNIVFKISKRDWVFVTSSIIVGVTLPLLMERLSYLL